MKKKFVFQGKEYVATLVSDSWSIVDSYGMVPPTSIAARIETQLGRPEGAEARAILAELSRRGVERLCHFTSVKNIQSILNLGVLPRKRLEVTGTLFQYSDAKREDKREDYSSLSISRPNLSMMLSKITDKGSLDNWVVFLIGLNVLVERGVLFFPWNAASSRYVDEPAECFQGFEAFIKSLPNPGDEFDQEEVMVPFSISPDQLLEIIVPYCPGSHRYDFGDNLKEEDGDYSLERPRGGRIRISEARFPFFPYN